MNRRLKVFIPSAVFLLSDEEGAGHPCPDWVSSLLLLRWSGLFLSRNLSGILAVCFFLATWQQKLLISRTFCLHSCLLAFLCNTVRVLQDPLLHHTISECKASSQSQEVRSSQYRTHPVVYYSEKCHHISISWHSCPKPSHRIVLKLCESRLLRRNIL